jgi:hypothetical protein
MKYARRQLIDMLKEGKGSLAQVYKTGHVLHWQYMHGQCYINEETGKEYLAFISPSAWGESYISEEDFSAGIGAYNKELMLLVPWIEGGEEATIAKDETNHAYYKPMAAEWAAHKEYMKNNPWGGTCTVSRLKKDGTPDKRCKDYKISS